MRILQVVHNWLTDNLGGVERYLYYLSKCLSENNEVHICCPGFGSRQDVVIEDSLIIHRLHRKLLFTTIKHILFKKSMYQDRLIEREFNFLLNYVKPDIVHFHHLLGLSAGCVSIVKKEGLPIVLTIHDYWFICPKIILFYIPQNAPCKFYNTTTRCYICFLLGVFYGICRAPWYLPIYLASIVINTPFLFGKRQEFLKKVLSEIDILIAPTNFAKEIFVRYGIPPEKIIVSYHGYDYSVFNGFKKKTTPGRIIFGYLGGFQKHKGIELLIEVFNKIKDTNVYLYIYGSKGERYYYNFLRYRIKNPNVMYKGGYKDPRDVFSDMDILIIPSICYEVSSLVAYEAFITRTPVIGSDIGVLKELIKEGINGFLFNPYYPDTLLEKIHRVIREPSIIDKLKEGIQNVKSIKEQCVEIENLYKGLLK